MKNYIIIFLCLSLLLCGCQAAGDNAGTEPTVAPTAAPTEEPTQEPTAAPTEPPLPAGQIRTETRWVTSAEGWSGEINYPKVYKPLHSVEEMKEWVDTVLPDITYDKDYYGASEIDYSRYDDAFFAKNSVVILIIAGAEDSNWGYKTIDFTRDTNGEYQLYFDYAVGSGPAIWGKEASVYFIDLIGVTDDAKVNIHNEDIYWDYQETEGAIWAGNGILADVLVTPTLDRPIPSETRWVATADTWTGEINYPNVYKPLHSVEEIQEWLDTMLPNMQYNGPEIDYSRYDDAFFEKNSVVVLVYEHEVSLDWMFGVGYLDQKTNGEYRLVYETNFYPLGKEQDAAIFFVDMLGVTDDAQVHVLYQGGNSDCLIYRKNGILADVCVTP